MAQTIDLRPAILKQLRKLKRALENPQPILKQIGAIVASDCRRAFEKQALGDIAWEPRYPGMKDPFLNIASALSDFISGRTTPKPNRFQDRPALVDSRNLRNTITSRVASSDTVLVGTNQQYANLHQEGGESIQTYDDSVKERIRDWLEGSEERFGSSKPFDIGLKVKISKGHRKPKERFVTHHGRSGQTEKQKSSRYAYYPKLGPLLHKNSFSQKVVARPFVGVTDSAESDIREAILRHFAKAQK